MKAKSSLPVSGGFVLAVDQCRVAAPIVDFSLDAKALRLSVGDFGNALLQQAAHLRMERAHAQLKICAVGDDVIGAPGLQHPHSNHRCLQWIDVARDHGLQRHHQAGSRHHRIGCLVRHSTVTTVAYQRNVDLVRGGHHWAFAKDQVPLRPAGHVVHAEDSVTRVFVEQAVVDHAYSATVAGAVFLCGLEDQVECP